MVQRAPNGLVGRTRDGVMTAAGSEERLQLPRPCPSSTRLERGRQRHFHAAPGQREQQGDSVRAKRRGWAARGGGESVNGSAVHEVLQRDLEFGLLQRAAP